MQDQLQSDAARYYNSRPKKATGAGVLFFNAKGELLVVKPTYLDRWLWVGGGIEENETPKAAAIRECQEEIGITPEGLRLAFVHYRPPKPDGQHESIHFVFTVDPVDDDFIDKVKIDHKEIEDAKFVAIGELPEFVSHQRANAVKTYLDNRSTGGDLYLEDGKLA